MADISYLCKNLSSFTFALKACQQVCPSNSLESKLQLTSVHALSLQDRLGASEPVLTGDCMLLDPYVHLHLPPKATHLYASMKVLSLHRGCSQPSSAWIAGCLRPLRKPLIGKRYWLSPCQRGETAAPQQASMLRKGAYRYIKGSKSVTGA